MARPGVGLPKLWLILMLAAAFSVAGGGCETNTRDTDIKRISIGEAKALWDRAQNQRDQATVVFLDPRPAKYYDAAHIPGARNLQLPQVDPKTERDPRLERYSNLIVYGDDPASPVAKGMTKRLMAVGYKGVRWYADGMKGWNDRGYPVAPPRQATPEPPAASSTPAAPAQGGGDHPENPPPAPAPGPTGSPPSSPAPETPK